MAWILAPGSQWTAINQWRTVCKENWVSSSPRTTDIAKNPKVLLISLFPLPICFNAYHVITICLFFPHKVLKKKLFEATYLIQKVLFLPVRQYADRHEMPENVTKVYESCNQIPISIKLLAWQLASRSLLTTFYTRTTLQKKFLFNRILAIR